MLILTLGTQASASTWIFNAVRAIFSVNEIHAASAMSEEGCQFLGMMPSGFDHFILKSHRMDNNLINLARISSARVIVTSRDPRDVLVSQKERFDSEYRDQIASLSRSLVSIASIPTSLDTMHLQYEDRFFERSDTIRRLASFLSLPVTDEQCESIFAALSPEAVRAQISTWVSEAAPRDTEEWDMATHWHPGHLGDGRSGKWVGALPDVARKAAEGALAPFHAPKDFRSEETFWSPYLFNGPETDGGGAVTLSVNGEASLLVHGPYLCLPVGRWMMRPVLKAPSDGRLIAIKMDAYTYADDRGVMEMKTLVLPITAKKAPSLEIDVVDHLHPLEFRLYSVNDGRKGTFEFGGVRLKYLGESSNLGLHPAMSRVA